MAIIVSSAGFGYPGTATLFTDVSFKVDTGSHVALIGDNAVGKSTLLRIIAGELDPEEGTVATDGTVRFMRQTIGQRHESLTVRQFLSSLGSRNQQDAEAELSAATAANEAQGTEDTGMRLAHAVSDWVDVDGYTLEASWDAATTRVLGRSLADSGARPLSTLSGGERKRLALEVLFLEDADILLLDEPDNFLDIPGKRWLETRITESKRTILMISHDRELLSNAVERVVTVEASGAWTHGGSFTDYPDARDQRNERLGDALTRWQNEERRLYRYCKTLKQRAAISEAMAARADAAESRWERFRAAGPPPAPPNEQRVSMQLRGADSGRRVLRCAELGLTNLTVPFSFDVYFGERVAILGANGTGKSHLIRLLGGEEIAHEGTFAIGARVEPGVFVQTNDRESFEGRAAGDPIRRLTGTEEGMMRSLARYGLHGTADQPFSTLSGGQQARLQILALELEGVNLLLLDEPTDNLDLISAEALQAALESFTGTVVAVTHDRWFMRGFDRFVIFNEDGTASEAADFEAALAVISQVGEVELRPGDLKPLSHV
jgi:ATPase subunit of ABC transporter with duplicated ATPase domains